MDPHIVGAILVAASAFGITGRYSGAGWFTIGLLGLSIGFMGIE